MYMVFKLTGIEHLEFYRYTLSYMCLYCVLRTTKHNLLIWQDMKNGIVFYIVFFVITLVMQPLKELDFHILISNTAICLYTFLLSMILRRTFRVIFIDKLSDNVMIIGIGDLAQNLYNTYRFNRFSMANPQCYIKCDDGFSFSQENKVTDLPIYDFKDIDKCIDSYKIDTVAVAVTQASREDLAYITDILGEFIRETNIDELPQLINVLIGQMSLVGPRPYLPREKEDMGVYYDAITNAKPGITGMWQVSGRSDVSFNKRLRLDEYYCKN